ncbi:hypothetical protein NG895_27040 [Aeoliella sp. ICT_H6.2]|uniref:Uncharacterized protein n=1 Tax=Aeoliella straminimaris TaxID=2954799 RepID=A0A9X2JJG6_9BACT|nr:hypothetical protein [Aeoliella straminimaris]MCO6047577.1 hypothetical protein [Aeoliella straminimaris]
MSNLPGRWWQPLAVQRHTPLPATLAALHLLVYAGYSVELADEAARFDVSRCFADHHAALPRV